MQCGAGAPGSVARHPWRPWAIALAATAVLVLVAAAAGYAALSKEPRHAAVKTTTVAQAPPPAAPAPTPTPTTPSATTPPPIAKAPHIKLKATTPPVVPTPTTPAAGGGGGGQKTPTTGTGGSGTEVKPAALLLDTNAASTYNPYAYPATGFGDPSLTVDGDPSTGWSAQVNPATAPGMAEGVLIDLKGTKKLSAAKLVTTTPGVTLQIYGADVKTVPASITDPAWAPLSRSLTVKKRHAKIPLHTKGKTYRFIAVWISGAPASAVGTPEKPGKVTLNEIELFPAS
jgi:hypothetical protein